MEEDLEQLRLQLDKAEEKAFLAQNDLDFARTENIALKNFIQNLFESCDSLDETELSLDIVLTNLKNNIRVFARDHGIDL